MIMKNCETLHIAEAVLGASHKSKNTKRLRPPFLRYPGGKQRLIQYILPHIIDQVYVSDRYIEPFAGSAAIFFALDPKRATLSDLNSDLIDLYIGIKKSPKAIWLIYKGFPDTKEGYYSVRSKVVGRQNTILKAARLLYLNRTCFKGMWRHNSKGEFTIGYGGQDRRWVISDANLVEVSNRLQHTSIIWSDFEPIIENAVAGDFLFLDPPYRPFSVEMADSHYVASRFTFNDQIRLAKVLRKASSRGVKWAMTNSSHAQITRLYRKNFIAPLSKGTGTKPGQIISSPGEVLVLNFKLNVG